MNYARRPFVVFILNKYSSYKYCSWFD